MAIVEFNPEVHFHGVPCKHGHEGIRFMVNNACAECTKIRTLKKYNSDRESWNKRNSEWHKTNREASNRIRERYFESNPGLSAYFNGKRRAALIQATPMWSDLEAIKSIYAKCPDGMTVDHIVPLNSDLVCGLHVPYNLQYLSGAENSAKSNRWWPDMPE